MKLKKGVIRLQATVRGVLLRRRIKRWHQSAIKIQTIQKIQKYKAAEKKLPENQESCGGDSGRMEGIQKTARGGI